MRRAALLLTYLLVAACAVAGLWHFSIDPLLASHELARIEARTVEIEPKNALIAAPVARENIAALRGIQRRTPTSIDVYMLLSMNAFILQQYDESVGYLNQALEIDHRPEIYLNRGLTYVQQRRVNDAVADFARAARFNDMYLSSVTASLQQAVRAKAGLL